MNASRSPHAAAALTLLALCAAATAQGNLEGYWKFDEAAGATALDSSGHGRNGAIHGATRATGHNGGALDFNGTSDYVGIPVDTALDNRTALTYCAWVYPRVDAHWHVVDKGDGDKRLYSEGIGRTMDGRVRYSTVHAFSQSDSATLVLNAWQHVAMTWSVADNTTRMYRNGVQVSYATQTVGTGVIQDDSGYPFFIGVRGTLLAGTFFSGLIDEVRIYSRALSAQEVAALAGPTAVHGCRGRAAMTTHLAVRPGSIVATFVNPGRNADLSVYSLSGVSLASVHNVASSSVELPTNGLAGQTCVLRLVSGTQTVTATVVAR
jgi:hypothetical protein